MTWEIRRGDALASLREMPDASVQCCVTSPPYWGLRDYGHTDQLGLEETPELYVARLVSIFQEVRRVLRDDGTLWLNLGDSYASDTKGSGGVGRSTLVGTPNDGNGQIFAARRVAHGLKPKDLVGIPWRVAFALQAAGWWLRSDIIWSKPNPMPESVTDRPTKAHEYLFLLAKSERYYYDAEAIKEPDVTRPQQWLSSDGRREIPGQTPQSKGIMQRAAALLGQGRNRRTVWSITTEPFPDAHFAVMPQALVEPCILAGSKPGDQVLDPFAGSGTVGVVALRHGRRFLGLELNPVYASMARNRIAGPLFADVSVD